MEKSNYTIREATELDKKIWNSHVTHPLQTWEWGEFRSAMGILVKRVIIHEGTSKPQYIQISFHRIPYTQFTVGYIPKGPLPTKPILAALSRVAKSQHALCIQVEPNVEKHTGTSIPNIPSLIPASHPLFTKYTFTIDLTRSEEDLLKIMHTKTRYNIKVAKKHNVTISEDDSIEAFHHYIRLSEETTKRQGFYAHNRAYHETMWNILHNAGIARLFTASYNGEILSTWIIFCLNSTMYYPYGASSRNHREVMAPTLLAWELIRWGKAHGFTTFDLWGAMGPDPNPKDPWYGFHRFKQGFSPTLIEYIGSFDYVIEPFWYKLYTLANTVRWSLLKIRARISQ